MKDFVKPVIDCGTEGGAKQSFKDECDVNKILARYAKTGLLTPVTSRSPAFVDVSSVGDYRSALENVRSAKALFMELPSGIRSEFQNDPAEFLDFCTDPDSEDRMRELGLLPALDPEPPVVVPDAVVEPPPPELGVADPPVEAPVSGSVGE